MWGIIVVGDLSLPPGLFKRIPRKKPGHRSTGTKVFYFSFFRAGFLSPPFFFFFSPFFLHLPNGSTSLGEVDTKGSVFVCICQRMVRKNPEQQRKRAQMYRRTKTRKKMSSDGKEQHQTTIAFLVNYSQASKHTCRHTPQPERRKG